jgi:thioesterase domain-containing protein
MLRRGKKDHDRLVCVHPGAGTIACYARIADALPEVTTYGIQHAAICGITEAGQTVSEIAEHYLELVVDAEPSGPYWLAGWSTGGLIAYEMATMLRAKGIRVDHLMLFDVYAAPQHSASMLGSSDAELAYHSFESPALDLEQMKALDRDTMLNYVIEHAKQQQVVPVDFNLLQARRFLDAMRSSLSACFSYEPKPYDGQVTLFRAAESDSEDNDATLGWGKYLSVEPNVVVVPGNHATMFSPPNIWTLIGEITRIARDTGSHSLLSSVQVDADAVFKTAQP